MDIRVRNLNHRLALQLPVDLPLGLVFVTGIVRGFQLPDDRRALFLLVDETHRLRCEVDVKRVNEMGLADGTVIRAGGHLQFDVKTADYYLHARDIEIVDANLATEGKTIDEPLPNAADANHSALTPILSDIERRAAANQLVQAELPSWVDQMAPEVIKQEMRLRENDPQTAVSLPPSAGETDAETDAAPEKEAALDALAKAMESEEEVELTPEMVQVLDVPTYELPTPQMNDEQDSTHQVSDENEPQDALVEPPLSSNYYPPEERPTDWVVIGLIGLLIIFVLLMAGILIFNVFA